MQHGVCVCLLLGTTVNPTKTVEPIDMQFGVWTSVGLRNCVLCGESASPRERGNFGSCSPPLKCIRLCNQQTPQQHGLQTCEQGTTKVRLQNGLTGRGGDKCGSDATFRQNSLTACYYRNAVGLTSIVDLGQHAA